MKKKYLFVSIILISLLLTGCEKQVCSYCGETKYCEEYKILDTTRYICKDCMNNPDVTTSSNVVSEYQAEPLDPSLFGVGSDKNKESESDNEVASSDENESGDNSSSASSDGNNNTNENNSGNSNNSNNDQAVSTKEQRDEVTGRLASLLSSLGLQLSPDPDNNKIYAITSSDGSDTGIKLAFDKSSSGKLKASVTKSSSADNSVFTNTCISTALAFVDSTDYSQVGYEIYNNACQYGNFTKYGCRFYYMDDSDSNGTCEFNVSYQ